MKKSSNKHRHTDIRARPARIARGGAVGEPDAGGPSFPARDTDEIAADGNRGEGGDDDESDDDQSQSLGLSPDHSFRALTGELAE